MLESSDRRRFRVEGGHGLAGFGFGSFFSGVLADELAFINEIREYQ